MKKQIILISMALILFGCISNKKESPILSSGDQDTISNHKPSERKQEMNGLVQAKRSDKNKSIVYEENESMDMEVGYHKSPSPSHSHHIHPPIHDDRVSHMNNEEYGQIIENKFTSPLEEALSTFSIDVDRASYSVMRRHIQNGNLPPKDAIRVEEMINYFDYDYKGPSNNQPFKLHTNLVSCPWENEHQILHIGLQGKRIETKNLPASNLVFLVDVSGSMSAANKLGLLKNAFKLLVNNLRPQDRVAIVTYAGHASIALESTAANEKKKILDALKNLSAGGSTAGAEGIKTAYKIATDHFIKNGNNRVILATDGDFNVGVSSEEGLEQLIEKQRTSGIFLSVLGFGMGNYKDNKMQTLANKGNGNHAYIDNIQEARKVLVSEFGGTLFTIAKDVKIQIEFNPAYVQSYRLIGYENRLLNKEDFNDDKKDAGELGAGHTVTAIYEIIPTGVKSSFSQSIDPLRYQNQKTENNFSKNGELATIKLRYKKPDGNKSIKIEEKINSKIVESNQKVDFSLAVAEYGMILKDSEYLEDKNLNPVIKRATNSQEHDPEGFKSELIRLMKATRDLDLIVDN